ncbi:MAG: Asp-tRNA(Asn)/Glu-tRNA(Gln) amidotransferase subunit GatC [Actinomycetia bacterium]|nr:Asp-tRNA(Asn)/Glu-tRNA(Gln) amidotransferase subunit GatC [Actinomycetes bacterium]
MALTKKDVEHIALLARLALTEEEKEKFREQLSQVLDHADKIAQLDTKNIIPTSHVLPIENVFREDKETECFSKEEALSNAPEKEDGAFVVPKIV